MESPSQGNLKQQAARIRYDLQARRGTAEGRGGRTTLEGTPPPKPPKGQTTPKGPTTPKGQTPPTGQTTPNGQKPQTPQQS
jgi:hypothetical protein